MLLKFLPLAHSLATPMAPSGRKTTKKHKAKNIRGLIRTPLFLLNLQCALHRILRQQRPTELLAYVNNYAFWRCKPNIFLIGNFCVSNEEFQLFKQLKCICLIMRCLVNWKGRILCAPKKLRNELFNTEEIIL